MGNNVGIKAHVNKDVIPEWEHKWLCMWLCNIIEKLPLEMLAFELSMLGQAES